ncbi:hypothetical protein T06_1303 [Trichinella sp. T6]|nr:hypothetical protein T06_1303 [Trichinella sp. T6]
MDPGVLHNDLWEFVNSTKRRPKIVKDDESSLNAAQKWDISDQKAKADLILSISPLELREIKDCETSNEICLKLASIYESKGPARKATLHKRLILNKMNNEQKRNDFLRVFFNCVDKLKAMDLEIADDLPTFDSLALRYFRLIRKLLNCNRVSRRVAEARIIENKIAGRMRSSQE